MTAPKNLIHLQRWGLAVISVVATLSFLSFGGCRKSSETGVVFGKSEIRVGDLTITAEVALTPAQLTQGLKYRRRLPENQGMIFIFPQPTVTGFWMKDTLIPLSIAFIDRKGRIVDILDMEPDDGKLSHLPSGPYLYALEMNRGWFERNNIRVGDRVDPGRGENR